jgi:hypothetical protein
MGMAWTHHVWIAGGCLILLSIGASTCIGLANTIGQERAPDHLRGRVSAVAGICLFGLFPIAALLVTSVADWMGMRATIFTTATIYTVGSIAVLAALGHQLSSPPPETAVVPIPDTAPTTTGTPS